MRVYDLVSRSSVFVRTLLLILFSAILVAQAGAHASLVETAPPEGTVLERAPERVVLTFNEPASLLAASLIRPDGKRTVPEDDAVSSIGNTISLALPDDLGQGTHVLSWRAASADGHPVSGTFMFSIGSSSLAAPADEATSGAGVRPLLWFARATMLVALLLGAGSSSFRMVASALPRQARQATLAVLPLGALAVVASIPLHGLDALGRPLRDIATPEVWSVTMTTGYGATALSALAALLLAGVAVGARRPQLAGWISLLSLAAIGLAASLSGHASSADPQWLTRTMVFLHVASIAWWAGELLPLAVVLRQDHAVADPPLMRFSLFIPFAILPLLVSGATLAVIQLGPPGPSWQTPYGYIFAAKLTLLLILFAVAAWNRWVLTAKVVAGQEAATRHLRRAIVVEIGIIIVIVGLAAGWRFTPPPRSLAAAESGHELVVTFSKARSAVLSLAPARIGPNSLIVRLLNADGEALTARTVRVILSNVESGIEGIESEGVRNPDGTWQMKEVFIPASGAWKVEVAARISDFEQMRASSSIDIVR